MPKQLEPPAPHNAPNVVEYVLNDRAVARVDVV